MFVFQVKCVAGEQPPTDDDGNIITGACVACPLHTYKTQASLDGDETGEEVWKAECIACGGEDGKNYTLDTGSTSPDQCMGEFILYEVRQKLKGVMSDHFSSNSLNCSVLTLRLAGAKKHPL